MNNKFVSLSQILQRAKEALQRGEKHEARYWAQIAASMAPNAEEPWLILAAVANPRASIAYLERALEINPNSEHVRAALNSARRKQLNEETLLVSQEANIPPAQVEALPQPNPVVQKERRFLYIPTPLRFLILALFLGAISAFFWAGSSFSALAAAHSRIGTSSQDSQIHYWSQADLPKPTYTPSPTAAFTPTESPFPTSSMSATSILTAAPVPTNPTQPSDGALLEPGSAEKLIIVSIHEQHLYAYQGSKLIYSFVISTGSNNSTVAGTYHILDKIPNAYGWNWNFWMPDWMGIYYVGSLENGFHALPLLDNGQRLWGDEIGTPVTYGCVVLGIADAQTLYDWAEVGTSVQINP
ncbi:MAG: L,D-transpeptidase family protein [Anaerolineales bacterium]